MSRNEFQEQAKRWLSTYKKDVLQVSDKGVWLRNGREYEHILPSDRYKLNILPSLREEFWHWFDTQEIHLQRDFHHLNSSQALCFNLFFPLLRKNPAGLATLLSVIEVDGQPTDQAFFEFQPDPTEGTCIDFSLHLKDGARINFEVKYTESEFGAAKTDNNHLEKFEKVYRSGVTLRFAPAFCTARQFLNHYQIMRNIWHLRDDTKDIAVFLFPKSNSALRHCEPVIRTCAIEPFRSHVRILYLEELVTALHAVGRSASQPEHLEEFHLKYLATSREVSKTRQLS